MKGLLGDLMEHHWEQLQVWAQRLGLGDRGTASRRCD